jgi:hypothetical protein
MPDERTRPPPPNGLDESVAGEEDPGASIDLAVRTPASPAASDQTAGVAQPGTSTPPMAPGDEAPAGTPGSGEDICRLCGGTGVLNGAACPDCEGTGKVDVGIGGA